MRKYAIINALVRKNRYRRYLEICTPDTGGTFSRVARGPLQVCHRLMYRCPPGFEDDSAIDFRSPDERIEGLLPPGTLYDIIFIDPWHTYECSQRDFQAGLALLAPGGTLVLHDCCPVERKMVSPAPPVPWRLWQGVSYCAYLDLVGSLPDATWYTVDTDYGCGVIRKRPGENQTAGSGEREIFQQWDRLRSRNQYDVFDFYEQHRRELLNLISVEDFLVREGIPRRFLLPTPAYGLQRAATWLHATYARFRRAGLARLRWRRWNHWFSTWKESK